MSKIYIDAIRDIANEMLSLSNLTPEEKSGVCMLLERVLEENGQSIEFNYLNWIEKGHQEWVLNGEDDMDKAYYEHGNDEEGRGEFSRHYF